jgi:hypothetical protein
MADLITSSGLAGIPLAKALHAYFPTARREDVYLAIGMAVALLQADLVVAEIELRLARAPDHREAA